MSLLLLLFLLFKSFSHQRWSLSDNKSPGLFSSILIYNAVVWIVSTHPLISKSSSPFNNPLVTEPRALVSIIIIVTFMFLSFFQFPCKVKVLILLFTFFQFYSMVSQDSKVHNSASSLCFVDYYKIRSPSRD